MPIHPQWTDIAIRLLCTIIAGFLVGFDRGEHGRPAGLRTTILVAMAACIAMIQANLLMPSNGKPPDSYVTLDLMRLPLGILSGMGFIGAGAIVRRENLVLGVTTAATLWFVTVLGLCFGGGQILLGISGLSIGIIVVAGLRHVESRIKQDRQGTLTVITSPGGPTEEEIRAGLFAQQYKITSCSLGFTTLGYTTAGESRDFTCQVSWRAGAGHHGAQHRSGVIQSRRRRESGVDTSGTRQ
jgi:putative Mg2+ transporter-C (MgtC) family protein